MVLNNNSLPSNNENVNNYDKTLEFLSNLFPTEDGYLGITTMKKKVVKTSHFPTTELEKAVLYAHQQAQNGSDAYFSLGLQPELPDSNSRGKTDTVFVIPGFWLDIDIANHIAHSAKNLPLDYYEASKLLSAFPFLPTVIVSSGYGLHVYWLFIIPRVFANESEKHEAIKLMKAFYTYMRIEARKHGWHLDNTTSLAQMLRVPYTFNYKNPEETRLVSIVEANYERRYSIQDLEQFLGQSLQPDDDSDTTTKQGSADDIIDNCLFMQHCHKNSRTLTEPEWHAMVNNFCHTVDGIDKIHDLSCDYPGYSEEETNEKIRQALQKKCPHTCTYIKEELGFDCPEDGCGPKVVSPLSHATNSTVIAYRMIKERQQSLIANPDNVFDDEILTSLAILERDLPEEYHSFKEEMRGKTSLQVLNRRVKEKRKEIKKKASLSQKRDLKKFDSIFQDIPIKELEVPQDFLVTKDGLFFLNRSTAEFICVSNTPVIITRYIINLDTGEQSVELAIYDKRKWRTIIVSRNIISTRNGIVTLPVRGLQVNSETAKYMVNYFHEFVIVNRDVISTSKAVNHFGWVQDNFIPGCPGEIILDLEDNTYQIAKGVRENGALESWKKNILPLRQYLIARFTIAAAFASPLLELLKQRVFVIHNWGRSKGGKTAATYAALSVWGDPDILRASFKDTAVAIERKAALFSNLLFVIDEKQVLESYKYDHLEAIIYQLTQGSSKGRGKKDGGFQQINTWANICISTGEEPITSNSSRGGVINRLLEIYGEPIPDEAEARNVYSWTGEQHGTAGVAFIRKLIELQEEQPDFIIEKSELAFETLCGNFPDGNMQYLKNIATVMLGDYLSSLWIFDKDESAAWEEALDLGLNIAQIISEEYIEDEAMRAYKYILNWYSSYIDNFTGESRPNFGFIENVFDGKTRYINIYSNVFDEVMQKAGFNSRRIKQDWAEKGLFLFEEATDNTPRRLSRRLTNPHTGINGTFISIIAEGETQNLKEQNSDGKIINLAAVFLLPDETESNK